MTRPLGWRWLGRAPYLAALAEQETRRDRLLAGDDDAEGLIFFEPEPIITLGRGARREHILDATGVTVAAVGRGGDVTYHGPGQLMVFPVVRLARGPVAYLAALASGLAALAAELGVPGAKWRRAPAGLWLAEAKLAACGIHIRRRVATHGYALNVATPPAAWSCIVPCGLPGHRVISLAEALAERGAAPPPLPDLAPRAALHLDRALSGAAATMRQAS
jgi:lipoate-protein ligase B